MSKQFPELREQLLRAGVAPRQVRRYLIELADHLADLTADEVRGGRLPADAESAAWIRLGGMDHLAKAMIEQRQFHSWGARAPWAMFGLAPLWALVASWVIVGGILWSGWRIFLAGAETPFGHRVHGFANLYFQFGRLIYFGAPIFIGWAIGLIAARQRLKVVWPIIGLLLVAWIGGMAQVHTSAPVLPAGAGQVSIGFTPEYAIQAIPGGIAHACILLAVTALPYLVWRLTTHFLSGRVRS